MNFYVVVRLPDRGDEQARDLPVRFSDRASAEEMCGHLNDTKLEEQTGYVVEERRSWSEG